MPNLIVSLHKGWYGRVRKLRLLIDGREVGAIRQGESVTLPLPAGAGTFEGRMDWDRTERVDLAGVTGDLRIDMQPHFSLNPFRSMGLQPIPIRISAEEVPSGN